MHQKYIRNVKTESLVRNHLIFSISEVEYFPVKAALFNLFYKCSNASKSSSNAFVSPCIFCCENAFVAFSLIFTLVYVKNAFKVKRAKCMQYKWVCKVGFVKQATAL